MVDLDLLGACVSTVGAAGLEVLAASDGDARRLEDLQFSLGEGPSGEAFRTAQPVLVADVGAAETRWLQFAAAVGARGVGGVYAFPLQLGAARSGVLTAYTRAGHQLSITQLGAGVAWAETARDLLLGAVDDDADSLPPGTSVPLRSVVYQAQGMLMVRLGISLADALVLLRAMAYADGVDINDLAAAVVSGVRAADPDAGAAQ
ncbi:GAF and ANTAR domain-containing protein [Nocardioides anomalus]|uniref:GAF and ANTAR domain-containing protein n=1 Tax=Nocardioides anomalus TaxID=2712223 RepID=A0A6G6WI28_9ACTN|nr:GAF and ANTAR domain-containing protein [Nocardioides anomalus]QIG44872.1 GAF and ANTAR domain-containing protein [Nocardioides anomalus]